MRVFPHLLQENESQRIEIVNLNFAIWRDSTTLEAKVREVFQVSNQQPLEFRNIKVFINAGSMCQGAWQVCEDKLYHEVHFDQVFAYMSQTVLGQSLLLNFLLRLIVYTKEECMVLTIVRQPVHPKDRTAWPMRLLRRLYFPFYFHKLMQRLNLLHYASNAYTESLNSQASYGYPMLHVVADMVIDSREARVIETEEIERRLREKAYRFKWISK